MDDADNYRRFDIAALLARAEKAEKKAVLWDKSGWEDLESLFAQLTTALARVAELEGEVEWQSIESAPKDGTPFLLNCEHGEGNRMTVIARWGGKGANGAWRDVAPDSYVGVVPNGRNYATAVWHPLPTPPRKET